MVTTYANVACIAGCLALCAIDPTPYADFISCVPISAAL